MLSIPPTKAVNQETRGPIIIIRVTAARANSHTATGWANRISVRHPLHRVVRPKRRQLLVQPVQLGSSSTILETSGRPDSPEDVFSPISPIVSADESSDRSISPIPGGSGRGRG